MATAPVVEANHEIVTEAHPLSRIAQGDAFNWPTLLVLVLFHAGAIAALFFFSWKAIAITAVLYFAGINLGICLGYHRLLTHRGYKVPRLLKYFFVTCGTLTLEGGPSTGWSTTASTINSPTATAIRTRPAKAVGGRMPDGSSMAKD